MCSVHANEKQYVLFTSSVFHTHMHTNIHAQHTPHTHCLICFLVVCMLHFLALSHAIAIIMCVDVFFFFRIVQFVMYSTSCDGMRHCCRIERQQQEIGHNNFVKYCYIQMKWERKKKKRRMIIEIDFFSPVSSGFRRLLCVPNPTSNNSE